MMQLDPMTVFAPTLGALDTEAHREQRRRLQRARDIASFAIGRWQDHDERAQRIAGVICEIASATIYAPLPLELLEETPPPRCH